MRHCADEVAVPVAQQTHRCGERRDGGRGGRMAKRIVEHCWTTWAAEKVLPKLERSLLRRDRCACIGQLELVEALKEGEMIAELFCLRDLFRGETVMA